MKECLKNLVDYWVERKEMTQILNPSTWRKSRCMVILVSFMSLVFANNDLQLNKKDGSGYYVRKRRGEDVESDPWLQACPFKLIFSTSFIDEKNSEWLSQNRIRIIVKIHHCELKDPN